MYLLIMRARSFFIETDILGQDPGIPAFVVRGQGLPVSAATHLPITLHSPKSEPFNPYSDKFIQ